MRCYATTDLDWRTHRALQLSPHSLATVGAKLKVGSHALYTVAHRRAFDRHVPPDNNSIDVALIPSKMHDRLTNGLAMSASVFFIAHAMDVDTLTTGRWTGLTLPHTDERLLHQPCYSRTHRDFTRHQPVNMVSMVSEMVIDRYIRKKMTPKHLSAVCSTVGIYSRGHRPESLDLVQEPG